MIGRICDIILGADGRATTVVITGRRLRRRRRQAGRGALLRAQGRPGRRRQPRAADRRHQGAAAGRPAYVATDPGRIERASKKASDWAKIAKDKAIELGKQAGDAVQGMREKMQTPAPAAKK